MTTTSTEDWLGQGGLPWNILLAATLEEVPATELLHTRLGRLAAAQALGRDLPPPAGTTAMGALVHHLTGGAEAKTFQPMNVNFGLFPPVEAKGGRRGRKDRYPAYTERAKQDFTAWLATA